jgi:two-component system nitrogen regulation sensor histidine kinase GlnL
MKELSFYTDKKLCIRSLNKGVEKFTEKTSSHIVGSKYYEILPRIFIDNNKDALSEAIKKKEMLSLKGYSFHCLYGNIKADITVDPVLSNKCHVDGVKVTIQPYTPCTVARKLRQSQKLIDIGKIASTLAHGVRNPLNAIKGAVVYLREKYTHEAPLIEFTKIMEDEILRLEAFITRFLSSSISDMELSPTDINALLKKIKVYTSLQAYTGNVRSIYEFGHIPPIMVNSFHLEQAILNVINNAIQAMHRGGQLTVKTFAEKRADASFAVIEISDTGPGIADGRIDDLAVNDKNDGKGFGLFTSYEILKYYHGHLEIDSKKGQGTTARLYLPTKQGM